jgi:hypothetical protein
VPIVLAVGGWECPERQPEAGPFLPRSRASGGGWFRAHPDPARSRGSRRSAEHCQYPCDLYAYDAYLLATCRAVRAPLLTLDGGLRHVALAARVSLVEV